MIIPKVLIYSKNEDDIENDLIGDDIDLDYDPELDYESDRFTNLQGCIICPDNRRCSLAERINSLGEEFFNRFRYVTSGSWFRDISGLSCEIGRGWKEDIEDFFDYYDDDMAS